MIEEIMAKLREIEALLHAIRDRITHCPNNGVKEVFDRELHREKQAKEGGV